MNLGSFSISLAVQDLRASMDFYAQLGFEPLEGFASVEEGWVMLVNGPAKIGLFEKMFEENLISFHPANIGPIRKALTDKNVEFEKDENGPEGNYLAFRDPDGNVILVDQIPGE